MTSRSRLPGLAVLDGAESVPLDVLPPQDAHGLLRMLVGSDIAPTPIPRRWRTSLTDVAICPSG